MRYTDKGAVITPCGRFRPRLWRRWNDALPVLPFMMLNPSEADGEEDDHTVRKCVGFAERFGYGGIEIVNLSDFRAKNPKDLKAAGWLVSPQNDAHISTVVRCYGPMLVVAWGVNANCAEGWARVKQVCELLDDLSADPHALCVTANGTPAHPLMLPYKSELQPWAVQ